MGGGSDRPVFVLDEALIRWQGREITVTPQQAAILGCLRKFAGQFVPIERLAVAVWPAQSPECFARQLYKQIGLLRRKLRGLPFMIEARWGFGYRLTGEIEVI